MDPSLGLRPSWASIDAMYPGVGRSNDEQGFVCET